ncbi:MAG: transcriptional regulator, family [Nocardioidaceae bacterium]|jgi:transcriptional regulator with XRE-family HTH domain|nr:transcriptional regulator, family [Nocardioidaceae bacterium]
MPSKSRPTIRRWQLGDELRRARVKADVTLKEAAAEIEVTPGTLSKIEGGKQLIKAMYIKLLAPKYGMAEADRERLLELAEEANQPGYWVSYSKLVPDWFRLFLGYEHDASKVRAYESELVPGLLQTPRYARAVALANKPTSTNAELDRQVDLRRARQERLVDDEPPTLHAVLNEAVLLRKVGGGEVMSEQLRHLAELADLDHVTIQVLPFEAGAHPAMTAPFLLLGFDDEPRMNTVYLENGRGSLYLEKPADLNRYEAMFDQLSGMAMTPDDSVTCLVRVAANL